MRAVPGGPPGPAHLLGVELSLLIPYSTCGRWWNRRPETPPICFQPTAQPPAVPVQSDKGGGQTSAVTCSQVQGGCGDTLPGPTCLCLTSVHGADETSSPLFSPEGRWSVLRESSGSFLGCRAFQYCSVAGQLFWTVLSHACPTDFLSRTP